MHRKMSQKASCMWHIAVLVHLTIHSAHGWRQRCLSCAGGKRGIMLPEPHWHHRLHAQGNWAGPVRAAVRVRETVGIGLGQP